MSRKKQQPDYLWFTFQVEGVPLLSVRSARGVPLTAKRFEALTCVHDAARPLALATTLIEVSAHLCRHVPGLSQALREMAAEVIAVDMTTGNQSEKAVREKEREDYPF